MSDRIEPAIGDSPDDPKGFKVPDAFLDESADLWVKSNDGVNFKVFKAFLMTASTMWRNMLQIAQSSSDGSSIDQPIPWDESAAIITGLLYQIYPIEKPDIATMEELASLVEAADKWLMDGVLAHLKSLLLSPRFLDRRPMAVYTLGCRVQGLGEVRRQSARRLVELYDPHDSSLRNDTVNLSALDFLALWDLRQKRIAYCLKVFDNHCPSHCPHWSEFVYGDWRRVLRGALSTQPSASCLGDVPATLDLFSRSTLCSDGCSTTVKGSVLAMRDALADHDHFLGDEIYL